MLMAGAQPVAGLGDAAAIRADGQTASIWVLKGDTLIAFAIFVSTGRDPSQSLTDVAGRVLSRIP